MLEEDPLAQAKRDLILEKRIVAALKERNLPSLLQLRIQADSGTVTLSGCVYSFYDRQISLHCARLVNGVIRLVDRIEVGPAPTFKDPESISRAAMGGIGLLLVLAVVGLAATSLRASDGHLRTFPVMGRILFNDQPVAGASVALYPKAGGNAAPHPHATVDKQGKFSLTTYEAADGAPTGEYLVTVEWPQAIGQGEDTRFVNALPPEYSAPRTTKLTAIVRDQPDNMVVFQLRGTPGVALNVGNSAAVERKEVRQDERANLGD